MKKITTPHGVFSENLDKCMSADEVYNDWLLNKNKPPKLTENEILKSEINFEKMIREVQQSEIDFLKLIGGI